MVARPTQLDKVCGAFDRPIEPQFVLVSLAKWRHPTRGAWAQQAEQGAE
jgi:hypothetical protein